jgi:hypothetical protein
MTRPSNGKRGKNRKSVPERAPTRPSKSAEANPIQKGTPASPILRNTHDHFVIQKLQTTPVGELAVDLVVRDATQTVPALRAVLSEVYLNAARARELSKAMKDQLLQRGRNCHRSPSSASRTPLHLPGNRLDVVGDHHKAYCVQGQTVAAKASPCNQ